MADILRDEGLLEVSSFIDRVTVVSSTLVQDKGSAFYSTLVTWDMPRNMCASGSAVRPKLGGLTDKADLWPRQVAEVVLETGMLIGLGWWVAWLWCV